jgi:hypothetical protein
MIRTGIPVLDEQLKGGIPIGKTFLFYMAPGINGDVFTFQTVYANLAENGVCYFLTSNSSPDVARASFREYGWDLTPHATRFAVIDGYSAEIGIPSHEPFVIDDPGSIESVDRAISDIIETLSPGDMIAISSLSSIFDSCRNEKVTGQVILDYARKWNKMAVLNGGVMLYSFSDRGYDRPLVEQIKEGLCNATVLVGGLGEARTYGDKFKLHTCDWARPPEWPTPYKVIKPGGVRAYIPKILVTGPRGSGKSTFVRTASLLSAGKTVSVDRAGTTVALDYANVSFRGLTLDLFGTPGQARFNPILRTLAKDAMGVILIVDSTDPKSFERASEILKIACGKTTPYIVAANKQDTKDALDPDQVRKKLELPAKVPVVGISALDPAGVMESLDQIVRKIVEAR